MLLAKRQCKLSPFSYVYCTDQIAESATFESAYANNSLFPLYFYPTEGLLSQRSILNYQTWALDVEGGNRYPNLSPSFIADLEAKLDLSFNPIQRKAGDGEFGPEGVFHYIYAILHSPTYRDRYAEFLKIDFPRIPLTADAALFRKLAAMGRELVGLHLLESPVVQQLISSFPVPGDNHVEKGYPRFTQVHDEPTGRVHINKTQYFEGVPPDVWEFYVGGYQVCEKWLKDRRGRQLTYDELAHYQQVVVALERTIVLMDAIDEAIPEWPIS